MTESYLLPNAVVQWRSGTENGMDDAPYSPEFDDIYWGRDAALAEKQSVFVDAFASHIGSVKPNSVVTVGELGFGFGINTLLTARFWQNQPTSAFLNIISIEKYPVRAKDLARLLDQYHFTHGKMLLDQYPPAYCGQHVIWLADNIRLLLVFDEAETALANLQARVDFWYLDGFSPSKNGQMWQAGVCRKMFARSRPGAGVTTYSAAGNVRRNLAGNGFIVNKVPGFGQKRERLNATRPGDWQLTGKPRGTTLIVGGGIAGLYCAEALRRRGLPFQLVDSGKPSPSMIPQLTVKPQLAAAPEVHYRFSLAASQYMQTSTGYQKTSILQSPRNSEEVTRFIRIAEQFPDDVIELGTNSSLLFHQGGWLSPQQLRQSLKIDAITASATRLANDNQWHCELDSGETITADHVILATGAGQELLPPQIVLRSIRGQAIDIPTHDVHRVESQEVTLFPTSNGRSIVSGTYSREDKMAPRSEETRYLATCAAEILGHKVDASSAKTWVGIRAATYDRVPVVGRAPATDSSDNNNLFLCTAFGSRGATHARLCAEHVASLIHGDPAPLGKREQKLLSPSRLKGRQ